MSSFGNTEGAIPESAHPTLLRSGIEMAEVHVTLPPRRMETLMAFCRDQLKHTSDSRFSRRGQRGYGVQFECEGAKIWVPDSGYMNMGVLAVLGSDWCLRHSVSVLDGSLRHLIAELAQCDADEINLRLTRIDLNFDVAYLRPMFDKQTIISRARARVTYAEGSHDSGISVGRGRLVLRIYNKTLEAARHGRLDYMRGIWSGHTGQVWRIEYQMRREFLSERRISTFGDFLRNAGDVIAYLLRWTRFAEPQARKDQDRTLVGWWAAASELIGNAPWDDAGPHLRELPPLPNPKYLRAQLSGVITAYAALENVLLGAEDMPTEPYEWVTALITGLMKSRKTAIVDEFLAKRRRLLAVHGYRNAGD